MLVGSSVSTKFLTTKRKRKERRICIYIRTGEQPTNQWSSLLVSIQLDKHRKELLGNQKKNQTGSMGGLLTNLPRAIFFSLSFSLLSIPIFTTTNRLSLMCLDFFLRVPSLKDIEAKLENNQIRSRRNQRHLAANRPAFQSTQEYNIHTRN